METTNQIFEIEKIEISSLPELAGLKEKQLQIVRENPFIAITDNETYNDAKKSRTTLVTARTEIQNQDKLIASKIKKFRENVAGVSAELIAITKPHEEKQQDEVKRYETLKEAEKAERQRIEDERKAQIKSNIDIIFSSANAKVQNLTFEMIETLQVDFEQNIFKTETEQFEEFELDFSEKLMTLKSNLEAKKLVLQEKENARIEAEKLAEAQKKLDADRKELEAKQKADNEKAEIERKKIADEQKAVQDKLDADRKALDAEKSKLEKEAQAKKDAEILEQKKADKIEADKAELARQEALKPEKEKAIDFINSLNFVKEMPTFEDKVFKAVILEFVSMTENYKNEVKELINKY